MDVTTAVEAELSLLTPAVRNDRAAVDALLADGFTELGASGRRWSRPDMLNSIGSFADTEELEVLELESRMIGVDVTLVTYITVRDGARTFRSSVWSRASGSWRLEHHQASALDRG